MPTLKLLSVVILLSTVAQAQSEDYHNYELALNGETYEFTIGKPITITLPDGTKTTALIRKKPISHFSFKTVSFKHRSDLTPAVSDLGDGVAQAALMTGNGTLVMIQSYEEMDPSPLVPFMLKELTKESIQYGYKMVQNKHTRKLADSTVLKGLKATLTYRKEVLTIEILAHPRRDAGTLLISQIDSEFLKTDQPMVDRFWTTLKLEK